MRSELDFAHGLSLRLCARIELDGRARIADIARLGWRTDDLPVC